MVILEILEISQYNENEIVYLRIDYSMMVWQSFRDIAVSDNTVVFGI